MAFLRRPVMMMMFSIPEAIHSSTAYWISGLSTTGSISLGWALVAGKKRVPRPAAGSTALRTFRIGGVMSLRRFFQRLRTIQFDAAHCQMETLEKCEESRLARECGCTRASARCMLRYEADRSIASEWIETRWNRAFRANSGDRIVLRRNRRGNRRARRDDSLERGR